MNVAAPPPTALSFFVRGVPMPKGSVVVRHQHGSILAGIGVRCACRQWVVPQADARLAEWDALVATAAKMAMRGMLPFEGFVRVSATFYFERPKSHGKAMRAIPWVAKPDSDKLLRSLFDAMTSAAVWRDDAFAMVGRVDKIYCDGFEQAGAQIEIEALS